MLFTRIWLGVSTALVLAGWLLSAVHGMNRWNYAVLLILLLVWGVRMSWAPGSARWRCPWKMRRPRGAAQWLRTAYQALRGLTLLGAVIHPLTTWDTLGYRLPRVFHWLAEGGWHWIHAPREWLNNRACVYEFLMTPLVAFRLTSWLWLPNLICFSLLPGLVFAVLRQLGTPRRAACYWMWLLPTTHVLLLQAGSTMNDLPGLFFLLASIYFALRFGTTGRFADLAWSTLAAALLTGVKFTHLPLAGIWLLLLLPRAGEIFRQRKSALLALALGAAGCSALPSMVLNHLHYGDWTGAKGEAELQATERTYALLGNAILGVTQNLAPPILLQPDSWDERLKKALPSGWRAGLERNFEKNFALSLGEVPSESRSGLGPTIFLLLGALLLARRGPASPAGDRASPVRWLILAGGLLATAVYSLTAAALTSARLTAVAHTSVILALLPAWHRRRPAVTYGGAWPWLCGLHFAVCLWTVFANPFRPLLPVKTVVALLPEKLRQSRLAQKAVQTVTVVPGHLYAYDPLRPFLPPATHAVSTVFDRDDVEAQLWVRFGFKRITAILGDTDLPALAGRPGEFVIANETALNARFGCSAEQFAARIGATIAGSATLHISNSGNPSRWYVLQTTPRL